MNHACVTLDEVLAAAGARAASIVSETSGYLTLALGDATSRSPMAIDEKGVTLSTEGTVSIARRGPSRTQEQAAAGLRAILARLLAVGTGTAMPSLAAAARARQESDRGVDAVVHEIEAALIPVNRAAARRALARLARETLKARENGSLQRKTLPHPIVLPSDPPSAPARDAEVPASAPSPIAASPIAASPVAPPVVEELAFELATVAPAAPVVFALREVPASHAVLAIDADDDDADEDEDEDEEPVFEDADLPSPEPETIAIPCAPAPSRREPTPTLLGMATIVETSLPGAAELAPTEGPAPSAEEARAFAAPAAEEPHLEAPIEPHVDAPEPATTEAIEASLPIALAPAAAPPSATPAPAPAIEEAPAAPIAAVGPAPTPRPAPAVILPACAPAARREHTRADELLARFGASCVDDAHLRETAACLRRMAGLDGTPPPPPLSVLPPRAALRQEEPVAAEPETAPDPMREMRRPLPSRRARSRPSLALTLMVLAIGAGGGAALTRLAPQLPAAIDAARDALRGAPTPASGGAQPPAAAVDAPPATVAPAADRAVPPRAERGTAQRQR